MKEALKVLSLQLWSASGALKKRHKENSLQAIKETWEISTHEFEATDGILFYGWFRRVRRKCHSDLSLFFVCVALAWVYVTT